MDKSPKVGIVLYFFVILSPVKNYVKLKMNVYAPLRGEIRHKKGKNTMTELRIIPQPVSVMRRAGIVELTPRTTILACGTLGIGDTMSTRYINGVVKHSISILFAAFALLAGNSLQGGENLVKFNSNFEAGLKGWVNFKYVNNVNTMGVNYPIKNPGFWEYAPPAIDSTTAAVGKNSVIISNPYGNYRYFCYPFLALETNTKYTVSCYLKTDTPGGKVNIKVRIYAGKYSEEEGFYLEPTKEWKRYSVTIMFKKIPNAGQVLFIGTPQFEWRPEGKPGPVIPRTIWIDAVQVEEGDLTDYKMGSPYEVNSTMNNDRYNRYYPGEKQTANINVYSQASDETLEVAYQIQDYNKNVVKKGHCPLAIQNHYGAAVLDLLVDKQGYFHVFLTLKKDGKVLKEWEEQFAVIRPHKNEDFGDDLCDDFDDDSYWGHHLPSISVYGGYEPFLVLNVLPADAVALANDVGVRWTRDFGIGAWTGVEYEENNFTFCDEWVNLLTTHNIRIMPVLGCQLRGTFPKWALSEQKLRDPYPHPLEGNEKKQLFMPKMDAWEKYIHTMVSHYKDRIHCWEIMNEPNWEMYPEDYLVLLKSAYETAKKADPDCVIVAPGSTDDFGINSMRFIEDLLKLGGGKYLDVVSFHFYLFSSRSKCSPENYPMPTSKMCNELQAVVDKYAPGKPTWSTEMSWGYSSDYYKKQSLKPDYMKRDLDPGMTPEVVAGYLVQNHTVNLGHGTKKYFDFVLEYMVDHDYTPNAVLPAYCNMVWMLDKTKFIRQFNFGEKIRCYTFQGKVKDSYVSVIWTIDEDNKGWLNLADENKVLMAGKKHITFFDMMGNIRQDARIEIGNSPIYIKGEDISLKEYLNYLERLNFSGLQTVRMGAVFSNDKTGPAIKVFLKSLFAQPVSGKIKITAVPEGMTLINNTNEYSFGPLTLEKQTSVIIIPVKVSGEVKGGLTVLQVGEQIKCLQKDIRLIRSRQTDQPLKIDGDLSGKEWSSPVVLDNREQISYGEKASWAGTDELSALVYSRWDKDNLYFGIDVKNKDMIVTPKESDLCNASSVELFLDTGEDKDIFDNNYTERCVQFVFSPACKDYPLRIIISKEGRGKKMDKEGIEAVSRLTTDGYQMEIKMPVRKLDLDQLSKGEAIGFNVSINDAKMFQGEIKRRHQMTLNGKSEVYRYRSQMESLVCE